MKNFFKLGQGGETIVEVLMVVVVLGSSLTTAFVLTNKASNNNQASQDRTEASSYGQDQLERLKSLLSVNDASLADKPNFCIGADNKAVKVTDLTAGGCIDTIRNIYGGYISYDNTTTTYTEHVNWDRAGSGRDNIQMVYRASYLQSGADSVLGSIPTGGPPITDCPTGLIPDGGVLVCYYNGTNFDTFVSQTIKNPYGSPLALNVNATDMIADDFSLGSPAQNVNTDLFSVRYQGRFFFEGGLYTFTAGSDDGMKLSIDGAVISTPAQNLPHSFPNPKYQIVQYIGAGLHTVQLDQYEDYGYASARLYWGKTTLVEAESLTPNGGLRIGNEPGASGNQIMIFASTGTATRKLNLPKSGSLSVLARGDQFQGAPLMNVRIDGNDYISNVPVANTGYQTFTAAIAPPIPAGSHTIEITFPNDACGNPCNGTTGDRNLFVDYISFTPNAP